MAVDLFDFRTKSLLDNISETELEAITGNISNHEPFAISTVQATISRTKISHFPITQRWKKDSKFYICSLQKNLFKEWELICSWGNYQTQLSRMICKPMSCYQNGIEELKQIAHLRKKAKYELLTSEMMETD